MATTTGRPRRPASPHRHRRPRLPFRSIAFAFVVGLAGFGLLRAVTDLPRPTDLSIGEEVAQAGAAAPKLELSLANHFTHFDNRPALGVPPLPLGGVGPLPSELASLGAAALELSAPQPQVEVAALPAPPPVIEPAPVAPKLDPVAPPLVQAPIPLRRPADLVLPPPAEKPLVAERTPRRMRQQAALPSQPAEDNRNFIEKLFGVSRPSGGTVLAYAAPQDDVIDEGRGRRLSPALPSAPPMGMAQATAIYDISAKTLFLPNGERLEAHSGLGELMDDPKNVHVRMRGATPPHVYNLTEREALFHGVRAVRMHPVGGPAAIHGRAGLLLHSYLLGPRGDSNGCVSVKDYDRFLQAFLRGEVKRLVVVASRG